MSWRYLPLAGVVLIVVITACVRPWLQWRRHGTFGILLFRSGRLAQTVRDALLVVLIALLVGQAAAAAFNRRGPGLLTAGQGAIHDVLQVAGATLLFAGIAVLAAAQLNLGASWRVGIKEDEAPGLVQDGLYRFCRHPIYLGLLTALVGYTLLLPTALSLALLAAAYVGARMQAAAEEAYLRRTYGEAFDVYARSVGRFLPGVGQL
ncbi:MAG TPA: isoprenylcysteine carboxylmethyltransferase family protein [Hyphomicrobiaceae bacterium]|jgi:protein-S-isoprenylcysteine O-methyltransferase Ste14|nr:isoprenylcysteine carboxylmethyltransferase family protein [Hyphomicrobiaceae bacterium]